MGNIIIGIRPFCACIGAADLIVGNGIARPRCTHPCVTYDKPTGHTTSYTSVLTMRHFENANVIVIGQCNQMRTFVAPLVDSSLICMAAHSPDTVLCMYSAQHQSVGPVMIGINAERKRSRIGIPCKVVRDGERCHKIVRRIRSLPRQHTDLGVLRKRSNVGM